MEDIKSVFLRKRRDMYEVTVRYTSPNGEVKTKCYEKFKRKKDAEKYLVEIKSSINNEKFILPNTLLFTDRCIKYYRDKEYEYSPKTVNNAYSIIKKHIKPYWADIKLNDITISMYQDFMNSLGKSNLSSTTIKKIYQISNATLRECYRLREINTNIPEFVFKPKSKNIAKNKSDLYTVEEIQLILEKCKDTKILEIPINLFLFAGMRFGEISGLCWEDIDFDNNTLNINHNLVYDEKNKTFTMRTPKTDSGIRTIIVPDAVIKLLDNEKRRQTKLLLQGLFKKNEYNVVCMNTQFRYLSENNFLQSYKRFLKNKCNLRYIRPHNLRHAHATLLLASGVDMKTVSERLGHSKIDITMNTYSHVLREMDQRASDNIERMLL